MQHFAIATAARGLRLGPTPELPKPKPSAELPEPSVELPEVEAEVEAEIEVEAQVEEPLWFEQAEGELYMAETLQTQSSAGVTRPRK